MDRDRDMERALDMDSDNPRRCDRLFPPNSLSQPHPPRLRLPPSMSDPGPIPGYGLAVGISLLPKVPEKWLLNLLAMLESTLLSGVCSPYPKIDASVPADMCLYCTQK
jgi:hypothetical protein